MKGKISEKVVRSVFLLEIVLALFIVVGIIIGSLDLIRYFKLIYKTPPLETFQVLQTFLGHTLTLVIGLELIIMLVRHTPSSIIEVLLYAIARKMIIESKTMLDIVLGIIAIAGLFTINKVFEPGQFFIRTGTIVNSALPVKDVNEMLGLNIPVDIGNTLGGVVSYLCKKQGETPFVGKVFKINDAEISIFSMDGDLINKLKVSKL